MRRRPTYVAASLQRHPTSHPRGSHAGTCIRPQTCTYRLGESACNPPAACNYRVGENALRPPAAPSHAASGSLAHVCNSQVQNLYRSPKDMRLQRHSHANSGIGAHLCVARVTAEQELRLQRHTSQEQEPRAKAHAENGMTCVCTNRFGHHGTKEVDEAPAESRSRHRIHPPSAPAVRRPDTPCSIGIPHIRRPPNMIFWSGCHARIAAQNTGSTNGMSIAGRTPWRLLVRLRCLVMA